MQNCRVQKRRRGQARENWTSRPSAFDAENSDPAANSDALTMTALAFDAEMLVISMLTSMSP